MRALMTERTWCLFAECKRCLTSTLVNFAVIQLLLSINYPIEVNTGTFLAGTTFAVRKTQPFALLYYGFADSSTPRVVVALVVHNARNTDRHGDLQL